MALPFPLYLRRHAAQLCAILAAIALAAVAVVSLAAAGRTAAVRPAIGVPARNQALPAATPLPSATVELSTTSIAQGGAFSVRLRAPSILASVARFNNHDYPMIGNGDLWYAILGAGQPVGSSEMLPAGDYPVTVLYQFDGSHEVQTALLTITVTPTNFPVDAIEVSEEKAQLLAPELVAEDATVLSNAYAGFTPVQLWQGPFIIPVQARVTTQFGSLRSYQGGPASGSHSGVDLGAMLGTPIAATGNGRVVWTGQVPERGQGVIVDHGLGVFSGYFHLSRIIAQSGQSVAQGDVVGLAGNTGLSTGPHLHWEIVVGGVNIDGLQWIQQTLP